MRSTTPSGWQKVQVHGVSADGTEARPSAEAARHQSGSDRNRDADKEECIMRFQSCSEHELRFEVQEEGEMVKSHFKLADNVFVRAQVNPGKNSVYLWLGVGYGCDATDLWCRAMND